MTQDDFNLLSTIGNTPLIELAKLPGPDDARVLVKLESKNPTGSSKDRSALSMIEEAERSGRLKPGQRVVEASGGSTGTALAMICALKGYACTIVTSDAFADEKLKTIQAFGATLDIIPSVHGKATYPELFDLMHARVEELGRIPGNHYLHQMKNPANPRAYNAMGREILAQTGGAVDAFTMTCGSGGCFSGTMEVFRAHRPEILGIAVEPAGYRHISGGPKGVHHIDGVGDGPPGELFRYEFVDGIEAVTDDEAYDMARRLAREEGIFGGKSAAANVVAALRVARRLGKGRTVTTVICDTGYKYLSGDLFTI
ncbi:PLP-dependent cysteine synthase family protein [Shinella pollutisoli]|uniref:PLP-dependent cysteine synthase family protein n=1 Tax=Shinella pollutisoli TaxID=2250594 RepID=A0ABV7DG39_9HYPH|nr:cysteine synthase family protein [Shinella pollutisoli]